MQEWLRLKFLNILGGFPDAQSAIEAVKSDEERRTLLNLAVKHLYNTIDADDILRVNENFDWVFMGKVLPPGVKDQLRAEAEHLLESRLWSILTADIQYQANKLMFLRSVTESDLVAGKLWTLTINSLRRRLKNMVAGSGMLQVTKKR